MRLGCQMHDRIRRGDRAFRSFTGEQRLGHAEVTNVAADKYVATVTMWPVPLVHVRQALEIARVRQQIQVHDRAPRIALQPPAHEVRADKSRTARNEEAPGLERRHPRLSSYRGRSARSAESG